MIFPGINNHAEVIAMFDRQIGTVAGHDQALARIVAQNKSRERDRTHDRLEGTRRHGDDQAFDLSEPYLFKIIARLRIYASSYQNWRWD